MRIALCDDDAASLDSLEKLVRAFCREQGLEAVIDRFGGGEEFLRAEGAGDSYDIVFMDIYLNPGEPTGMQLIHSLGDSHGTQVVFVTTSTDHALEAIGLNAAHYLVKPASGENVAEAMRRCLERSQYRPSRMLDIKTGKGTVSIPAESIRYIEVFNKLSVLHTAKGEVKTRASLDSLSELLDEGRFMRAQRSYLVNMSFIDSISFDRLKLKNGAWIMLSRNNRAELKNQYQTFLFRFARGE